MRSAYGFESQRYVPLALVQAKLRLLNYKQQSSTSIATHLTDFNALVDVVEDYGGNIADHIALLTYEIQ